jgi:cysteine-rich repeat protein
MAELVLAASGTNAVDEDIIVEARAVNREASEEEDINNEEAPDEAPARASDDVEQQQGTNNEAADGGKRKSNAKLIYIGVCVLVLIIIAIVLGIVLGLTLSETAGAGRTCDQLVILQNRDRRYVTLDATNALSWAEGAADESDAEFFIRVPTVNGFMLKSTSNGNFVEFRGTTLSATGANGVVINTEACGTNPAGFGALRADTNADGKALNEMGNYWQSDASSLILADSCLKADSGSWEKFRLVVTSADVDCNGPTLICDDGIQNQGEEGVDCGGPCAQDCGAVTGYCGDGIVNPELGGEQCDDGNDFSCDGCDANCQLETAAGTCDQVVILQNRDRRYATLDITNALSWAQGTVDQRGAEVFIRESTGCGFTLKSTSNGNFVELQGATLSATGANGVVINTEACGTNPEGFGALRADTSADGNALNDMNNYWQSDASLDLVGSCPAASAISWEKFRVVVTSADVDCNGPLL